MDIFQPSGIPFDVPSSDTGGLGAPVRVLAPLAIVSLVTGLTSLTSLTPGRPFLSGGGGGNPQRPDMPNGVRPDMDSATGEFWVAVTDMTTGDGVTELETLE